MKRLMEVQRYDMEMLGNHSKSLLCTSQYKDNLLLKNTVERNDLLIFGYCRHFEAYNKLFCTLSNDIIDCISKFRLFIYTTMVEMDGSTLIESITDNAGYKLEPLSMFPSVRSSVSVKKEKGKYYYEFEITQVSTTANDMNLAQIGWCDDKCIAYDSDMTGIGDDIHSWAFDGGRVKKWHNGESSIYGKKWNVGDVVGCCIDVHGDDNNTFDIGYYLNGEFLGKAYTNYRYSGCLYAACSFQKRYAYGQIVFGKDQFKFLPDGYEPIF